MNGATGAMPDVCVACGRLFPRTTVRLCAACAKDDDKRFMLVRKFLETNRGKSLAEVAHATGLSRGEISRFYHEGRLVDVDPGGGGIVAGSCVCGGVGPPCTVCRVRVQRRLKMMSNALEDEAQRIADDDGGRVQYTRRSRRERDAS